MKVGAKTLRTESVSALEKHYTKCVFKYYTVLESLVHVNAAAQNRIWI